MAGVEVVEKAYIYALCCPLSGDIRYVGKTNNIERRLSQHTRLSEFRRGTTKKQSWISSIVKKGEKPLIFVVEECCEDDWKGREMFWIKEFRNRGFNLVNGTDGGDMPSRDKGACAKGSKKTPLWKVMARLSNTRAWLKKNGGDTSKIDKNIKNIKLAVKEIERKLGSKLGREWLNLMLEERLNEKRAS